MGYYTLHINRNRVSLTVTCIYIDMQNGGYIRESAKEMGYRELQPEQEEEMKQFVLRRDVLTICSFTDRVRKSLC